MLMYWWPFLLFLIPVFISGVIFANPFDSFENELKEYIESETYQYYDGQDTQIKELFSNEESKSEEATKSSTGYSTVSSNYKLPTRIAITRLISTTIIRADRKITEGYKVKPKDTLSALARRYRVTVDRLKKLNGLRSDIIRVGQILRISTSKPQTASTIYKMRLFALPVLNGRVTSRFGFRRDPFNPNVKNYHSGLDLSAPVGTPVIASADGIVEFKGRNGGYGNTVIIRHKGGYRTIYAHCSSTTVEVGDKVTMGTVIGSVGRTGTATGAHLHFEVSLRGKLIDPERALRKVEIVTGKHPSQIKS